MEESGEYSKLKKKLKRKAKESEKNLSSKKCKLLQEYEDKTTENVKITERTKKFSSKGEDAQTNVGSMNTDKGEKENKAKKVKSKKTKTKKHKQKVKVTDSVEDEKESHKNKKIKHEKQSSIEGDKVVKDKLAERELKSKPDRSLESKSDVKEKKREKRRLKKAAKLKQKQDAKGPVEGGVLVSGVGKDQALDYLQKWKNDRDKWNFQKVRQVWLLQHMYNIKLVSDEDFVILMEYLEGLQGKARSLTVQKAESVMEKAEEVEEAEQIDKERLTRESDRARQIIQLLS